MLGWYQVNCLWVTDILLGPLNSVDEGEFQQRQKYEDGAHDRVDVQGFDVAHFGDRRWHMAG